jgi:hypothetical protein
MIDRIAIAEEVPFDITTQYTKQGLLQKCVSDVGGVAAKVGTDFCSRGVNDIRPRLLYFAHRSKHACQNELCMIA